MKLKVSLLSNIFLIAAALIGGYALIDIYLLKINLPEGMCPVIRNRPMLYGAIVLCVLSFMLSFFKDKGKVNKPADGQ